jgi:hypothetical protein
MSKAEYSFDVLAEICRLTRLDSKLFLGNGAGGRYADVPVSCRAVCQKSRKQPPRPAWPLDSFGASDRCR